MQVFAYIEILAFRFRRVFPRTKVMNLLPYFLRPLPVLMGKQREVLAGFLGLGFRHGDAPAGVVSGVVILDRLTAGSRNVIKHYLREWRNWQTRWI